jgi:ketosteroid isomerase-like protein
MKTHILIIFTVFLIHFSCSKETRKNNTEKWKNEILAAEQEFADMAKNKGIREAFLAYAADDAVIMRNNTLVIGKKDITEFLNNQPQSGEDASLAWKPDFVDVSASGDLGYTYGKYVYSYSDSSGTKQELTGVFHTVWKRQADGSWRYVWD